MTLTPSGASVPPVFAVLEVAILLASSYKYPVNQGKSVLLLKRRGWLVGLVLVATLSSACLGPREHFTLSVENTAGDAVPEACKGGLKAKLVLSDIVIYEETVAEGGSGKR